MNHSNWWVYSVELAVTGDAARKLARRSPDRDPALPQVYVSRSTTSPWDLFAGGLDRTKAREPVATHGVRLREDLVMVNGLTEEESYRRRSQATEQLRREGYGVFNARPRRSHYVYVIDLDPAVRNEPHVRRSNPVADPDKPCVYVGRTGKTIKARRKQHREGKYPGRGYVGKYGFGRPFLTHLFEHLNPCLPEDAIRHERELAEQLRARGYTVTGGH